MRVSKVKGQYAHGRPIFLVKDDEFIFRIGMHYVRQWSNTSKATYQISRPIIVDFIFVISRQTTSHFRKLVKLVFLVSSSFYFSPIIFFVKNKVAVIEEESGQPLYSGASCSFHHTYCNKYMD